MREYTKPFIEDEDIELEDVIAISGPSNEPFNILTDNPEGEDL